MKITSATTVRRLLAAICLVVLGANAALAQQIEPAEGRALVERGALLVDVRTPEEFAAGHVAGAINIPHLEVEARLVEFGADHEREIVVYCRSGNRSGLAGARSGTFWGFWSAVNKLKLDNRAPDILVLDEPTSALDPATEMIVARNLRESLRGRTVIIITHRPALSEIADKVVNLREGRIWTELMPA